MRQRRKAPSTSSSTTAQSARGNQERRAGQEVRVAAHLGPAYEHTLSFEALELPERSCLCQSGKGSVIPGGEALVGGEPVACDGGGALRPAVGQDAAPP